MLVAGCSSSDDPAGDPTTTPTAGPTFTERGVHHYVLEYDYDTNEPIFGGSHEIIIPEDRGKAEAIDTPNKPSRLHPQLREYMTYDPTNTSGESDWDVIASQWWPQSKNGLAQRWNASGAYKDDLEDTSDKDNLSPAEKYDVVFYPGQSKKVATVEHWNADERRKPVADRPAKHNHPEITVVGPTTKWELENHGIYQTRSHPDSWWGHCNGWASYVTTEAGGYPQRDIKIKLVDGKITECIDSLDGDPDCVLFRMGDIEALLTELYFSDKSTFAGRRCNTDPDKMERDEYGRPKEAACRDLNPGSFHVGATGLLGKGAKHFATKEQKKLAFVIDHNYDWEVWNFPVVKFEVTSAQEITAEKANELIGAQGSTYAFNDDAVKFIEVKLTYWMVSDGVSMDKMLMRGDQRGVAPDETNLHYILELDGNDKILGGEWLQVPTYTWGGELKDLHPDFYWMGTQVQGYGESNDDLGGSDDNPYVAYSKVKALLNCANDASSCAPTAPPAADGPCVGKCGSSSTEDSKTCYCDEACIKHNDCCSDYQETCVGSGSDAPSCEGKCGEQSSTNGKSCWCDDQCSKYEDCCEDYAQHCGS